MQLEGKTVLITGAGSGIGEAFAKVCAEAGARLILTGRRPEKLSATATLAGVGRCLMVPGDVTQAAHRQALLAVIGRTHGRLDVLVNNAGVSSVGDHAELADIAITDMVATNLLAPMLLVRDLLPLLRQARPGSRIVNIGSVFGDIAYPLFAAYSATKFGLRGFSDAMRRELAPHGIGVTYFAPRATRTAATTAFESLIEPFAMQVDPAEVAAAQLLTALKRDARSAYAYGIERLFVLVQRLAPGIVDRAIARQLAQIDRRSSASSHSL